MSALGRMSGIADKFSTASDLMQGAADDARDENVQIKEKQPRSPNRASSLTPKKESKVQQMTSRSRPEAQAIKHYNEHNQTVINKHLPAPKDSAKDLQTKQVALAQQQAISMKQLNNTMAEILHVLERDKNKITPKYQEFSKSKGYGEINGQARDGMIDKLGSMMGDLMRDFKDTLGGLADSLGKKKSNSRRARDRLARRRESARIRAGGAPGAGPGGGGWWSNAGQRAANMFGGGGGGAGHGGGHGGGAGAGGGAPRPAGGGGGRVGTALKIAAAGAAAVGGYEGVKWVGGKLGMVAKSEESGKGGVGTVSTGKGDHGGVSYGSHQLSSNKGSMAAYLQSPDGQPYAQELAGLQPGSAAFTAKYKEIAARDPVAFEKSQDSYLARTHYSPQVNKVSKDTGEDFSKRGRGIQEMLYSTGVQYGPGSGVVGAALKGMDTKNMSDAQIIQTVQDYKNKTTNAYFKRSDADTKASVAARALREKDKLLAVDKQEREAKAAGVKAEEEPKQNVTMAEAAGKAAPAAKPQEDPVAVATPTPSAIFNPSAADLMAPPATPTPTPVASAPVSGPEPESETVGIMPLTAAAAGIGAGAFMPAMPKIDPTVPRGGATATPGAASGAGRRMSKLLPGASVAIGAYDAYGILSDEQATKEEKERGLAGVGGGMAGAAAGGSAGAALGAAAGSLFFGVGAIPGAIVGGGLGLAGGMLGYDLGASAGESLYDAAKGSPEEQRASEVASSNMPVAGSTPLLMLTQQHADETGDKQSVSAAAAMATVDAAIQKSMAPVRARTQEELEMEATQKAYDQMVKDFPSPLDSPTAPEAIAPVTAPVTAPNAAPFAAKEETYEILTGPNTKPNVMPALPAAEGEVKILPASSAVTSSVPQSPQEVNAMFANAATAGAAAGVASAAKTLPQALSKEKTPEAEGMMSKIAGGLSGVAGALAAGLGLPPGWAESITSGYGQALAEQSAAMNGASPAKTPAAQSPQPQAQSTLPLPTTPASALTPVSKPVQELQEGEVTVLPGSGSTPPVVTAPVVSQPAPPTSPASPEYYKDTDVSPSASSLAASSAPSTVASSAAAAPTVSSTSAAPSPVERQQYEPVKSVMMLEPKTQDTLMPARAQPAGDRMPSQGVSEGGSVRPTIDEAPAIITDQGLVLLQTGMI